MDLSVGLSSIKTAMEIVKLIYDSGVSLEEAETRAKMAILVSALADAETALSQARTEINELRARIQVGAYPVVPG